MAGWIPIDTVGGVALANLKALAGVILVSFLTGLVARNALASKVVRNLESRFLMKIPGHTIVKGIKGEFEDESAMQLKPVALALGTAERIGYEVQRLPDGRSMDFIPSVPNIWSGITQILPEDQMTYLDVPFMSVMELTERYRFGVDSLLAAKMASAAAPPGDRES